MAGALYIWIILAVFIVVAGLMILLGILFWAGHWWEKKSTGATHGFLEVPEAARSRPAPRSADLPDNNLKAPAPDQPPQTRN